MVKESSKSIEINIIMKIKMPFLLIEETALKFKQNQMSFFPGWQFSFFYECGNNLYPIGFTGVQHFNFVTQIYKIRIQYRRGENKAHNQLLTCTNIVNILLRAFVCRKKAEARCQMQDLRLEVRSQKSEVRCQLSVVRCQKSEIQFPVSGLRLS